MVDEAFDDAHVDVELAGAAPVDFRDIDIWQNVQKGVFLPVPAQRFAGDDGLSCFRGESLRRQLVDIRGRAKEGVNRIKPSVI